jgi:hypothetical protein
MRGGLINYAGLAVCGIAIVMLLMASSKRWSRSYKARKAAKKG